MYLDEDHYTIGVVNAKIDPSGRPEIPRKLSVEFSSIGVTLQSSRIGYDAYVSLMRNNRICHDDKFM